MTTSVKLATMGVALLTLFLPWAFAQTNQDSPEQILFQSANRERTAQGLPPLKWSAALAEAAAEAAAGGSVDALRVAGRGWVVSDDGAAREI